MGQSSVSTILMDDIKTIRFTYQCRYPIFCLAKQGTGGFGLLNRVPRKHSKAGKEHIVALTIRTSRWVVAHLAVHFVRDSALGIGAAVTALINRRRAAHDLAKFDGRMLADIGLTRNDVEFGVCRADLARPDTPPCRHRDRAPKRRPCGARGEPHQTREKGVPRACDELRKAGLSPPFSFCPNSLLKKPRTSSPWIAPGPVPSFRGSRAPSPLPD